MITIDFIDDGLSSSLASLAKQFNAEKNENYFSIPPDIGNGPVIQSNVGDGLIIYLWDINLSYDLQITRMQQLSQNSYRLSFFIEPTNLKFRFDSGSAYRVSDVSHYCFVLAAKAKIDLLINKNTRCRYLTLIVPSSMLPTNIKHELRNQVQNNPLGFRFFTLKFDEFKGVTDLFDTVIKNESLIRIKLKASVLLDAMISNIHFLASTRLKKISMDQHKMLNIEKKIIDNVESTIPPLSKLAKELQISESSMKRHFKMIFGKSIYQYYLEKKMQHAKLLLLNKHMNVSEVSAKLGYEKVSHFIKMFKKHIGYLPGKLKN